MTRTVLEDSALTCPAMDRGTLARYREAMKAASALSLSFQDFLRGRDEAEVSAWIRTSLSSSRHLFQPWTMEIVYLAALFGSTRFSQLEQALGVSSRTLSRKLKELVEAGFLERTLHDETPVRIEYTLTKDGRRAAALAAPLFTFLNQCAMAKQG